MKESYTSMTRGKKAAMPDKVLVDTSVWIQFFRRKDSSVSSTLRRYLELDQVCCAGPVIIELYKGARTSREIDAINDLLETIHYVEITRMHYQHAGQISYEAARRG